MTDIPDHCAQLVRENDRDRYLATLFAPADRRSALFALYAFNSEVARIGEVTREPFAGEVRLQWWRDVIEGTRAEEATAHPVAATLGAAIEHYAISREALSLIVDGRQFDLYAEPMTTIETLESYAAKTSSTLMHVAAAILGKIDAEAVACIEPLGIAYAITGLLRAFPLHAARGQLYVPLELLDRHGAALDDVFAGRATDGIRAALADMRAIAIRYLDTAREKWPADAAAIAPALLPGALVRPSLAHLARRSAEPFRLDEIPQWRRQWILWSAARSRRAFV